MTAVRGADFAVTTEFKGMTSSSSHFLIFTAEAQSKAIEKHSASQRLCGQFNRTQPVTTQVGRLEIAATTTQ